MAHWVPGNRPNPGSHQLLATSHSPIRRISGGTVHFQPHRVCNEKLCLAIILPLVICKRWRRHGSFISMKEPFVNVDNVKDATFWGIVVIFFTNITFSFFGLVNKYEVNITFKKDIEACRCISWVSILNQPKKFFVRSFDVRWRL